MIQAPSNRMFTVEVLYKIILKRIDAPGKEYADG